MWLLQHFSTRRYDHHYYKDLTGNNWTFLGLAFVQAQNLVQSASPLSNRRTLAAKPLYAIRYISCIIHLIDIAFFQKQLLRTIMHKNYSEKSGKF